LLRQALTSETEGVLQLAEEDLGARKARLRVGVHALKVSRAVDEEHTGAIAYERSVSVAVQRVVEGGRNIPLQLFEGDGVGLVATAAQQRHGQQSQE
jgi:hypothetical protein